MACRKMGKPSGDPERDVYQAYEVHSVRLEYGRLIHNQVEQTVIDERFDLSIHVKKTFRRAIWEWPCWPQGLIVARNADRSYSGRKEPPEATAALCKSINNE